MTRRLVLAAVCIAAVVPALSTTQAATPSGPYSGFSTASIVHVDAITTSTLRLANVEVGVVNAAVNSAGLQPVLSEHLRPVLARDATSAFKSSATGSVAEVGVVLSPPESANQIAPFRADSLAPSASQDVTGDLLPPTAIGPVAFVNLAHRSAATRWNNGTCVIGEPIAAGRQHLARVEVLETADDPDTAASDGFDTPVVGIDSTVGGWHRTSSNVAAVEQLYKGSGPGFGLQSVIATTLAPVTLFQGTTNEFTIEVDGIAFLSATADGMANGAKITFDVPLVNIIQNGVATEVLPGEPIEIRVPGTGDAIAEVRVGVLDALAAPKGLGGTTTTASNGTRAAAQAHVVEVKLLDLATSGLRGATVALGHMEAVSSVPAGGITCPLPVTKVANPRVVSVGNSFTTTITVNNPFKCPLTNVTLGDVIGIEKASRFAVTKSVPAASASTAGTNLSAGSARWSLGTIPAGTSKSVVLTLRALGGAGRILDTATATATLGSCPAQPSRSAADVTGLAKINVPATGIGTLSITTTGTRVLGRELVPTGVADVMAIAGGLVLLMFGLIAAASLRRRV